MEYPVVKIKSHSFTDASATGIIVKSMRLKCAMLTACGKEQQGVVLTDDGPRGQQEGSRESRRLLFGTPYGTCVPQPPRCARGLIILVPTTMQSPLIRFQYQGRSSN